MYSMHMLYQRFVYTHCTHTALQSRKGAINLTGATVSIPSGDVGVPYGLLLKAPHSSNKRGYVRLIGCKLCVSVECINMHLHLSHNSSNFN